MSHGGGDAQHRGWGPGWPNCQGGKIVPLVVSNVSFPAGVHRDIKELVTLLLQETERRGYKLVQGWCWGYYCRAISGSSTPSNHSWGLAVDINAPTNPFTSGPLVTDMPVWMRNLWKSYGFRWGGDYVSVKDAMHYEFMGTPQDAARQTERARRELGGEDDMAFEDFKAGYRWARDNPGRANPPAHFNGDQKFGFNARRLAERGQHPHPFAAVGHEHASQGNGDGEVAEHRHRTPATGEVIRE